MPPLAGYADRLWDHWERKLDPDLYKDHSLRAALSGRTVLITGASSGIGRATALKVAAAGGAPLLVARTREKLEATKAEIEAAGGTAFVYDADLSDMEAIAGVVARALADHARIDFLVNNAEAIRRRHPAGLDSSYAPGRQGSRARGCEHGRAVQPLVTRHSATSRSRRWPAGCRGGGRGNG